MGKYSVIIQILLKIGGQTIIIVSRICIIEQSTSPLSFNLKGEFILAINECFTFFCPSTNEHV